MVGPFLIKAKQSILKGHKALLTSLINIAIYGEMIKSMGTDTFMLVFGCFIERPGEVKSVWSVKRELKKRIKELNHKKIVNTC